MGKEGAAAKRAKIEEGIKETRVRKDARRTVLKQGLRDVHLATRCPE